MLIPPDEIDGWAGDALRKLYWDGIVQLPWRWEPHAIAAFTAHLKSQPIYPGHVPSHGDGAPRPWAAGLTLPIASHTMDATVTAPHFMDYALGFTALARRCLGAPPRLYSCHSFWVRPSVEAALDIHTQCWHRDHDDTRFLTLFLYGTDVIAEADGAHCYAKGTHRNHDGTHREPTGPVETVLAKAGSAFLVDGQGLHRGIRPLANERLLCWARWGVSDRPRSYDWDKLEPVPASRIPLSREPDQKTREATTLVVDWTA